MMKRILIIPLLLFCIDCMGQNIIIQNNVNTNGTSSTQQECGYKINGVCSSEDIGGVDAQVYFSGGFRLKLTNYNQFPVTVLYEAEYNHGDDYKTGTVVLSAYNTANSEKVISLHDGRLSVWSLVGIIVRKLKN